MEKKENTSSPVGVLEDYFRSEDSETSSSKEPTPSSNSKSNSKSNFRWHGLAELFRRNSRTARASLDPFSVIKLSIRKSSSMKEGINTEPYNAKSPQKIFSLHDLQAATNNFSFENLIGKGGYAEVYKGHLQDGESVAIKRLTRGTTDEMIADFLSELGIMAHVNHPNTAKLIGYGVEGGMHIVLELSPNGSLASLLYGMKEKLKWSVRYKIALGIAEGLLYLHEGCQRRIIHRDIKAANILLTEDFVPRICDFGLAKWLPEKWTHHILSKVEGTFGYLAPEFLMHGIVDEKTDVFAFGVLLLELVTGRRALDYSRQSLVLWAKPLLRKNEIKELVDPSMGKDYDFKQVNLVLLAAYICVQQSSLRRPQMCQVVQLLKGNLSCLKFMKKCRSPLVRRTLRQELSNAEDHNSTKMNSFPQNRN
ncbi:receptor-like cytosolic serine/threonine-protein kinase RBK2 [Mangifera indica]|uniref:receptor-like cytosolic serine/threonine-protein kinase RBK2 n=1 Tax=Mangifera indica TaxID=29780 RepID=UPI001CF9D569|nr:receptor-like cytosolic serine/threonine-protein kinase RBK2 [Mangifera indica]XP_044501139.1 receptor-like cytosolic serine/threonine-protein kinase RBK2 [Mangifera indica]XP_044501140.1 receptor-like cytosolic serine/threonine-protein kinase RBK2 [Mangifera indica]